MPNPKNVDNLPLNERIAAREKAISRSLATMPARAAQRVADAPAKSVVSYESESKATRTAAVVSTWQQPPQMPTNYERVAREGYGANEIIYSCVEELSTSAAEPILRAYDFSDEQVSDDHPILTLLGQPNPFLTGYDYIASTIMYRSIAGNVYTEKVFDNGGKLSELWLIRPDRMEVLPDARVGVGGYRYRFGQQVYDYAVEEIGHYKIRNPLDARYGMAPMNVLLSRTDTDNFAREFTKAFFFNAGVPSSLLAFKSLLDDQERNMIRNRFQHDYVGQNGWHNVMVTEQNEVEVKQLGMPMGARGIAYPELDEINEARIAMVFGVPLTLIGARISQKGGSYANKVSDREMFWNETLVPIYKEIEANFNSWLVPHFPDIKYLKFDLTTVHAFADETDVLHARVRNNFTQGIISWREARRELGLMEDPSADDIMIIPQQYAYLKVKDFLKGMSEQVLLPSSGTANGADRINENGHDTRPFVPSRNGNSNGNHA